MANDLITRLLLETKQFDGNITKATREVQDFQSKCSSLSSKLSTGLDVIGKFAPQLAVAGGAIGAFNKYMHSTEQLTDTFDRSIQVATTTVDSFWISLATGNFDNFVAGLSKIADSAKEAFDAVDDLGTLISFQDAEIAEIQTKRVKLEYQIKVGQSKGEDVTGLQKQLEETNNEIVQLMQERADQATKAFTASIKSAVQSATGGWYDPSIAEKYTNWDNFKLLDINELKKEEREIEKIKSQLGSTYDMVVANYSKYNSLREQGIASEKTLQALNLVDQERELAIKKAAVQEEEKLVKALDYRKAASYAMANAYNALKESIKYLGEGKESTPKTTVKQELTFDANVNTLKGMQDNVKYLQNQLQNLDVNSEEFEKVSHELDNWNAKLQMFNGSFAITPETITKVENKSQDLNDRLHNMSVLTSAVAGGFGAAQDSGVQAFGTILQSIIPLIGATMALAVAEGEENAARTSKNWYELVAAVITVGTTIASVFAANKNAGKYANGGIVQAASTVGDQNLVRVNGGEMILNGSQQANLFKLLDEGKTQPSNMLNGNVQFRISGRDLVGTLNNYNSKYGKL